MPDETNGQVTDQTVTENPPQQTPTSAEPSSEASPPSGNAFDRFLKGDLPGMKSDSGSQEAPIRSEGVLNPETDVPTDLVRPLVKQEVGPRKPAQQPEPTRRDEKGNIQPGRDYTGLEAHEQAWFRNMGGDAFKALKPMYLEYKKLKASDGTSKAAFEKQLAEARNARFYEIEGAHTLDPEVQKLEGALHHIDFEINHFQKQLENLRAGEPVQMLAVNNKGEVVLDDPEDPSPKLEAELIRSLNTAIVNRSTYGQKHAAAVQNFKGQFTKYYGEMDAVRKRVFGPHEEAIKGGTEKYLDLIPPLLRSRPEVLFGCQAMAMADLFANYAKSLEAKLAGDKLNNGARRGAVNGEDVIQDESGAGKPPEDPKTVMKNFRERYKSLRG